MLQTKSEIKDTNLKQAYDQWLQGWRKVDVPLMLSLFEGAGSDLVYQAEENKELICTFEGLTNYWNAAQEQLHLQIKKWEELERRVSIFDSIATIYVVLDTSIVAELIAPGDIVGDLRVSIVFRRAGTKWHIVHYHESRQFLVEKDGSTYRFLTDARIA
jgi:hypothetical protein